jgi:hypothetical protein
MTTMRAPGLARGGLYFVLGVLFSAALVLVVRAAYGFTSFDGGLTTNAQNAPIRGGTTSGSTPITR